MELRRRNLHIWTTAAVVALVTCALSVAQLAYSRQRHLDAGRELAQALSNSAAQRLLSGLQSLDQLLQEAARRLANDEIAVQDALAPLRAKMAAHNDIRSLSFVDGNGILRHLLPRQSAPPRLTPPADIADRPHVAYQLRHWREDGLVLAPPALDRLNDTSAWYASRPVIGVDGHLIGLAVLALDPDLLAAPLRAATPGEGDAAGVFSSDGMLFARNPFSPQNVGLSIADSAVYQAYSALGDSGGVTDLTSISDNIRRVVGFTPVPGYPLVVNVGISHDRMLTQWWREVQIHGGIQAALTVTLFILAWGMTRAQRRQRAATEQLRASEREHIERLSAEVAERTADLRTSLDALQESEERFRLIADISPLPLVVTRRADSHVIYINAQAAEAFQVPQHLAKGKIAPNFWEKPEDRARMVEALVRDGYIRNLEAVLKRADGQRFTALLSGAFGSLQGEAIVLISVQDISERKHLEEELARSNAELERFSYAISHDLQEPLRMVASYVGLLDRRYGDKLDEQGREFVAYAVDGAKRMSRMISDLLEYSRVGRQNWQFQATDLNLVATEALANLEASIQSSRARVTVGQLPTVPADPGQIMRVMQNLIGNALKYRSPDRIAEINVQSRCDGPNWTIAVSDNGRGFDPAETPRLFQVFQRLHANGGVDGSGIGLALCRSIVLAHGGTIWAHSDGPDRGATFSFSLPMVEQAGAKEGAQ